MVKLCRLLVYCLLLFNNFVEAKNLGAATLQAKSGTRCTYVLPATYQADSKIIIDPGAKAEGIVNITDGSVTASNNTQITDASASIDISNGSVQATGSTKLSTKDSKGPITVSGTGCLLELTGGTAPVTFNAGANASIAGTVNTPVVLPQGNSATLNLSGSTKIGDNNPCFATAGTNVTVNACNNSLTLGVQPKRQSANVTFNACADMQFTSKITLTGEWIFAGNAFVGGNGNILDLSLGGTIRIKKNTQLNLADMKVRGLVIGKILFDDTTAQIRTSFIEIEMNRNYSFTTGGIYAEGPTNIVTKNRVLTFSQEGSLTVDGIALTYDTTTFTDAQNIRPFGQTAGPNIALLNNGIIRHLSNSDLVSNLSNSIVSLNQCCRTNSNALVFSNKNNSNAIINLSNQVRVNSNALLYCCGVNSLANKNNSNAIINLSNQVRVNSNALLYCCRTNSNALVFGNKNNSNAIVNLSKQVRVNSNALLYCCRTNSNAIVYGLKNLSNAIIKLDVCCRTNSNALLYGNKNNSNALLYCCRVNSNALKYGIKNNSNAILFGLKNLSNTILYNNRNNSNAIVFGLKNLSNALLYCCRTTSNALVYGLKNLSNSVLYLNRTTSSALLFGDKNNSNALLYCCRVNSAALVYGIHNNSQAIVWLDTQLQTIDHGPLNIDITTSTTYLRYDIYLSREHKMFVHVDCTLDGHGHFIHFAHTTTNLLNITSGKTLLLKNVVLKGITPNDINLGGNSHILFGDGTLVELFADPDLNMTWTFIGQTTLSGQGEKLKFDSQGGIYVSGKGSALLFDNICLSGVDGNKIRCSDDTNTLSFYGTTWVQDGNYTLTTGRFEVISDWDLVGSYTFEYATKAASLIQPNGTLFLDLGFTFSYAPKSNNRDLIQMADSSSRLYMNGATLASSTTGLRLTKGSLIIDKKNFLRNDGAVALSEAITFGNNKVSANDLSIFIIPGANFELLSGVLDYQNSN